MECHLPYGITQCYLLPDTVMQAGTRFTYPGGIEGWVDLVDLIAPRPGVEPATFRSRVQRLTNATTKTSIRRRGRSNEKFCQSVETSAGGLVDCNGSASAAGPGNWSRLERLSAAQWWVHQTVRMPAVCWWDRSDGTAMLDPKPPYLAAKLNIFSINRKAAGKKFG